MMRLPDVGCCLLAVCDCWPHVHVVLLLRKGILAGIKDSRGILSSGCCGCSSSCGRYRRHIDAGQGVVVGDSRNQGWRWMVSRCGCGGGCGCS
ncbi:hypothetical protein EDB80DRAFT_725080 [Ilyonectria destructans]|nr:hypothetical protein EDB80DRAFT_725080 [Ilyonectria destructans]